MKDPDLQALALSSYLSGDNADFLESLYESFLKNPDAVAPEWQEYFESLPNVNDVSGQDISHADIRQHFLQLAKQPHIVARLPKETAAKQVSVERFVQAYRRFGHLASKLDPLGSASPEISQLDLAYYGLNTTDYDAHFRMENLMGEPTSSLLDIEAKLKTIYCQSIGAEYMHIQSQEEIDWIQQRLERRYDQDMFTSENRLAILQSLSNAETLEKYLGTKYIGQKRFSLEGGDSLIPMLHEMVEQARHHSVREIVIGMAHRGRLNVMVNILGQSVDLLFHESDDQEDNHHTSGDVKYHLGFSSDISTASGPIHLSLAFNPSHLEIISPVILGSVRARQHMRRDEKRDEVIAIIMHGDVAFTGQGIVMEAFSMSQTRANTVGGTVHFVVNNQIGFTTNNPRDIRSSLYCTDVAKMVDIPIFHVNGDDPESALFISRLALDYRMRFHKNVIIDLVCYRRHGHQEVDEPMATQPLLYKKIAKHPTTREIYANHLIQLNVCSQEKVDQLMMNYRQTLDEQGKVVNTISNGLSHERQENWNRYLEKQENIDVDTSFVKEKLITLAKKLTEIPKGFDLQRQVGLMMQTRKKMSEGKLPLDWGFAEILTYASLLTEDFYVRLVGQDSRRGAFAHRHAVLHDQLSGQRYIPMDQVCASKYTFQIYDSLLSEAGAMAFEYGYAKTDPQTLVIWEAQFGDFVNNAQAVIDQFLSSAWQKWKQLCGLVLFLPHGYEGMGPEHSSARLERFMQLCAQRNMQVCIPTTPAQVFHLLRRQMLRPLRIPLVIMTPKSLLRHKLAVSSLDDLAYGKFQLLIPEEDDLAITNVKKLVICSGKIFYELFVKRRKEEKNDVAIIRIEQLYPFPKEALIEQLKIYAHVRNVVWCQEEPKNQGAWYSIRHWLEGCLQPGQQLSYIGRKFSAAPDTGYVSVYQKQQEKLIEEALKL